MTTRDRPIETRMPLVLWTYVTLVAALAAVSVFAQVGAAYLVLLVVTLPLGIAAQLMNMMLVLGLGALLELDLDRNYPVLGVISVTIWTLTAWANAQLFHLGWRSARVRLAKRSARRESV